MTDQYLTVATVGDDPNMQRRVAACAAQQGVADDPTSWAFLNRLRWAASPGWGAAWDSAVAGGVPDPGADPSVITDGQILATVQQMVGSG